jgi:TonB family protein
MAFGKLIFVGALLLLVIAFIIAIGHTSSSGSNPTPTTETTNTTAGSNDTTSSSRTEETSDSKPSFSVTSGNTIYHGAISSNVGVAVISVSSQPFLMGIGNLIRPDGKFILVTLAISNRQHDAITMSDGLFEIADPYGNVYSASDKSMEVDNENNLFLAQINPGIIKVGEVIFDVPRDLSLTNLQLRFRGGMTGESAQVALMADTTVVPPPNPSLETEQTASSQEPPTSSVANSASGVTNQFGLQGSSAAPRSAADAVHHPGGSVLYPKLIHSAAPEYTEEARQAKLSGTVRLYLLVDKNGNPSHVQVVKGLGMGLDQSAISAVEQYRFEPATENGVPVTVDLYTDVKFQML